LVQSTCSGSKELYEVLKWPPDSYKIWMMNEWTGGEARCNLFVLYKFPDLSLTHTIIHLTTHASLLLSARDYCHFIKSANIASCLSSTKISTIMTWHWNGMLSFFILRKIPYMKLQRDKQNIKNNKCHSYSQK